MKTVTFDCETGPLPLAQIAHLKPEFTAPANWKDSAKIQASIAEQEAKWLSEAALSAVTGRVLCIGYLMDNEFHCIYGDNSEALVLTDFWNLMDDWLGGSVTVTGFCIRSFDLPFLVRRSAFHSLRPPHRLWEKSRYFNSDIIDVADLWSCGARDPRDRISLDTLAKFLGIGQKNGDGADFHKLWVSDRPKALDYLKNDLELCAQAYERMKLF